MPIFYLLVYILYRVITEVNLFVNIFLGTGLMAALVLFFAKKPERKRTVSLMSGDLDKTYDHLYKRLSEEGFHIETVHYQVTDIHADGKIEVGQNRVHPFQGV